MRNSEQFLPSATALQAAKQSHPIDTRRTRRPVLHAGRGRGAVASRAAAAAGGAGAAGRRVRGGRRAQGAPHGRRAHAAPRPAAARGRAARHGRRARRGHDHQRARADAPAARAAARRPHGAQRVAGLAARRPLRAHGAAPGPQARAGGRGPGAAARLPARQDQHRAHERVQRRRDRRLRRVHARPRRGSQVHRVHAVHGQPLGGRQNGAPPGRGPGAPAGPARRGAAAAPPQRHCRRVASPGVRGQRGVHLVHDAALLRLVQPAAPHGRRQPEGVPVRGGRGQPARPPAGRGLRPGAGRAHPRRAAQQARPARRHAVPRAHGEPAHDPHRRLAARAFCTWTHLDARGRAAMVDVGAKAETAREAEAECTLRVGAALLRLLRHGAVPKGDALAAARLAGVMAAKRTHHLVPLCHALPLHSVRVDVRLPEGEGEGGGHITVRCEARATARTGVEMEALTGAAVAALTLYDMCKAVDRSMRICDLRVVRKSGGKRDFCEASDPRP